MKKLLDNLLSHISEGALVVDENRNVIYSNQRFQSMMGIHPHNLYGHPAGVAKEGDWVIVVCNAVGMEKEVLSKEDLPLIGIKCKELSDGDGILAIGQIGGNEKNAEFRLLKKDEKIDVVNLKTTINDKTEILAQINNNDNIMTVIVNNVKFDMRYQLQNALTVILDKETLEVKFYQERGYTLRKEGFRDLIEGKPYEEKMENDSYNDVYKFDNLNPGKRCITYIDEILSGEKEDVKNLQVNINAVYYIMSAYGVKNEDTGKRCCAIILNDLTYIKNLQEQVKIERKSDKAFKNIIGSSQAVKNQINTAKKIARSQSTVLLLGESGTGKGAFAKAIHNCSKRADKPFVSINMAAIPSELIESELFGYEKGAFTGANTTGKIGKFEAAKGGTLFMDEIGEMNLSIQAKLLQVLQEKKFYPVGSSKPRDIDVRIIAATNRDLEQEVKDGNFRLDLYYRLNVINLELLPLRSKKEDLRELVEYNLPIISERIDRKVTHVTDEVMDLFFLYDWPGNVREVENTLEYAANITEKDYIGVEDLPDRFTDSLYKLLNKTKNIVTIQEAANQSEKDAIIRALKVTGGNRSRAAALLNIGRTTFYNKLKKYNLMDE